MWVTAAIAQAEWPLGVLMFPAPGAVLDRVKISATLAGAFALSVALIVGAAPQAGAKSVTVRAEVGNQGPVTGLIVAYEDGFAPTESSGAVTGSSEVPAVNLRLGHDIGFGMRTVVLPQATSVGNAEAIAADLARSPAVKWAQPDYVVSASGSPKSRPARPSSGSVVTVPGNTVDHSSVRAPLFRGVGSRALQVAPPWGLDRIDQRAGLDNQYTYDSTGAGVTAYDVDTGMRYSHNEFAGRVPYGAYAVDDGWGAQDCNGHGTHVSGTLGGTTYGVAKRVSLVPVRVLDCSGSGYTSDMVAGLDWIVADHSYGSPAVVNMSVGSEANYSLDLAVQRVVDDNITVVVASGNEATNACASSPARVPSAITVNASTYPDDDASFSNYGSCTDIYAPGVSVVSSYYTSDSATATFSGTSMASPHVAGAAARILSQNPTFSPAQVDQRIKSTATAVDFLPGIPSDAKALLYMAAPSAAPGPPASLGLLSFPYPNMARIAWSRPADPGTGAWSGYRVRVSAANSATTFSPWLNQSGTNRMLSGLVNGATYQVQVVAVSSAGTSLPRTLTFRQATTSSAVRSLRVAVTPAAGRTTITWAAPASNGGTPVLRYLMRISAPNTSTYGAWMQNATATRTLMNLRKGSTYRVQVVAVNTQGNSTPVTLTFRQAR